MTEHAFTAVLNAKRFSQDDSFSLCHSRESGNPELMVWARKEEKASGTFLTGGLCLLFRLTPKPRNATVPLIGR
jgi:hypothetical protein